MIFKWLWDFDHKHNWQFDRKEEVHSYFLTKSMEEKLVYKCECGKVIIVKEGN